MTSSLPSSSFVSVNREATLNVPIPSSTQPANSIFRATVPTEPHQPERATAIAQLRSIPSAFSPSGQMDLIAIVKHYLRKNPLLSMGDSLGYHSNVQTLAQFHRGLFIRKLSDMQILIEGTHPNMMRLDSTISLLQQHLISTCCDDDFVHDLRGQDDPFDPFLQHLTLNLIECGAGGKDAPIRLNDELLTKCKDFKKAIDASWAHEDTRQPKIYQIAEHLFHKKRERPTIPMVISDYIESLLQRHVLEQPERTLPQLVRFTNQSLSPLIACVTNPFFFGPEPSNDLKQRIDEISLQNDLLWRGMKLYPSLWPQDKIFTTYSLPFQCLKRQFEQHLIPHPLLHYDCILAAWKQELFLSHPSYRNHSSLLDLWGPRYFKFLWYNHARISSNSPTRAIPTVQLFLQWHAAQELRHSPGLTQEELTTKLATDASLLIPEYPIDHTDLAIACNRLMMKKTNHSR